MRFVLKISKMYKYTPLQLSKHQQLTYSNDCFIENQKVLQFYFRFNTFTIHTITASKTTTPIHINPFCHQYSTFTSTLFSI